MATIWEDSKTQAEKMKGRSFKEKAAYIWEYYRIPIIIILAVLIFTISIIKAVATSKDPGISIALVNAVSPSSAEDYSDWQEDLTDLLELNTKKYDVEIDNTMSLGTASSEGDMYYTSQQKMIALMSSQSLDILVMNTSIYEHYAQLDCFSDLSQILPEDLFEEYSEKGLIYYTDAATFSDYEDSEDTDADPDSDHAAMTIDHTDPSTMTDPVAVGIIVTDSQKIAEKQIYIWLQGQDDYQGYPEQAVLGIPANSPRTDAAVKTIEYLMD